MPHDLTFAEDDVEFLLAPEDDHERMRKVAWPLLTAKPEPFLGVVLDPRWTITQIQGAIKGMLS